MGQRGGGGGGGNGPKGRRWGEEVMYLCSLLHLPQHGCDVVIIGCDVHIFPPPPPCLCHGFLSPLYHHVKV